MSELDILNCAASGQVRFTFRCPMKWHEMQLTDSPRKRFCVQCNRAVYLCHDANEAGIRADQDECVAVPAWLVEGARDQLQPWNIEIAGRVTRRDILAEVAREYVRNKE